MKDNNLKDISRNEDIMNIYTRFNSDEFKEKQREDIIKFNKLLERKEKHNFSRHKYYLKYGK